MGSRGPKRTSTKVLNVRGSWRGKQRAQTEPKVAPALPPCPPWLDAEAKKAWKRIGGELLERRTISKGDEAVLAVYCQAWSDVRRYTLLLRRLGETFETESGYIAQRPEISFLKAARAQLLKAAAMLGLSPADLSRTKPLDGDDAEKGDPLGRLIGAIGGGPA